MTATAALLTVMVPAGAALIGLVLGKGDTGSARDWGLLGAVAALAAAVVELVGVLGGETAASASLLGRLDTGTGPEISLGLRADELSALVAVAVGVVAFCVQLYSTAYVGEHDSEDHPARYQAYAATVSMFTAAMMLVVHSGDLLLLLVGWEVMGIASYLLVGHHSEREDARASAVKAFLVTRVGDLGLLLAVVVLLISTGTSSIARLTELAQAGEIPHGTLTAALLLALLGVAGKSAQFPLHTWLPDAMAGPTPVSALIHAATMVVAGVFLVARLLPLYLQVPAALDVAAVIAAITMLGAALAALAQEDLKRLLAWSTVSQVAYMLAGIAVATDAAGAGPGVFHLLTHAAFKALLFLVAGCIAYLVGSNRLADMGGLLKARPRLAWLFGLGLASLAGLPPLSGFWSKEAVLSAAEHAAGEGSWAGWIVLTSGLVTTLVTGVYAARAWVIVALGDPEPHAHDGELPLAMRIPLVVLAVPTLLFGLVLIDPPALLEGVTLDPQATVTGALVSVVGVLWALSAPSLGTRDVTLAIPGPIRVFLHDGYRLDQLQTALVVRPFRALARGVGVGDRDVVDVWVRLSGLAANGAGSALRQLNRGFATAYLSWVFAGAVVAAVAGLAVAR